MGTEAGLRARLQRAGRTSRVAGWLVIAAVVLTAAIRSMFLIEYRGVLVGPILGGLEIWLYLLIVSHPAPGEDGLESLTRLGELVLTARVIEMLIALGLMIRLLIVGLRLIRNGAAAVRSRVPWGWPSILTAVFIAGLADTAVLTGGRGRSVPDLIVALIGGAVGLGLLLYARYLLPVVPVSTVDRVK